MPLTITLLMFELINQIASVGAANDSVATMANHAVLACRGASFKARNEAIHTAISKHDAAFQGNWAWPKMGVESKIAETRQNP